MLFGCMCFIPSSTMVAPIVGLPIYDFCSTPISWLLGPERALTGDTIGLTRLVEILVLVWCLNVGG